MKHAFGEGIQRIYTAGEAFRKNRATRRFPGLLRAFVYLYCLAVIEAKNQNLRPDVFNGFFQSCYNVGPGTGAMVFAILLNQIYRRYQPVISNNNL